MVDEVIQMWRSRIKNQRGQALVEMALVLPILLLIVFGIVEFGRIYTYQLQINSIAREGARIAAVSGKTDDSTIVASMYSKIGGSGSIDGVVKEATITRLPTENLSATPPTISTEVTSYIKLPVKVYAPIISSIISSNPVILEASVTMRIE